jgi:hypothetical protein
VEMAWLMLHEMKHDFAAYMQNTNIQKHAKKWPLTGEKLQVLNARKMKDCSFPALLMSYSTTI